MIAATVLIPTHNHGPLLYHSVATALTQTVSNIEVFIVGDGVNDETRKVVTELMEDGRVRYFDHPKGPRNGELYRHGVLAEARGEVVCYLADDDLWLPNHVETMRSLLRSADFCHAPYFLVDADGILRAPMQGSLELTLHRNHILTGINHIPLSFGAHTLDFYQKLPFGWRTTPLGTATDLYMWQQLLAHPSCCPVTSALPTALNFPDPMRKDWPVERRMVELQTWRERIQRPDFMLLALETSIRDRAAEEARIEAWAIAAEEELALAREKLAKVLPRTVSGAGLLTRLNGLKYYAKGATMLLFPELAELYRARRRRRLTR